MLNVRVASTFRNQLQGELQIQQKHLPDNLQYHRRIKIVSTTFLGYQAGSDLTAKVPKRLLGAILKNAVCCLAV
jgi:hypothetical protein